MSLDKGSAFLKSHIVTAKNKKTRRITVSGPVSVLRSKLELTLTFKRFPPLPPLLHPTNWHWTCCWWYVEVLASKIAGNGTREGTVARLTPLVLVCTVLYTSSKEQTDRDRRDSDGESARIWQMPLMYKHEGSLFCRNYLWIRVGFVVCEKPQRETERENDSASTCTKPQP